MGNQKIVFCQLSVDEDRAREDGKEVGEHVEDELGWLCESGIQLCEWMEAGPDYKKDPWRAYLHHLMEWAFKHYEEPEDKEKCSPLSFEAWQKAFEKPKHLYNVHILYDGRYCCTQVGANSSDEAIRNVENIIDTAKEYHIISVCEN